MVAMTGERQVKSRRGEQFSRPMAAGARILQGAIVCLSVGVATKGVTALNLVADGVALETVDNTGGAAGAKRIEVQPGFQYFANSTAGDLIALVDAGNDCFIVDDQTVAKTNGGGTRSRAGKVHDVDINGVLVNIGLGR